MDRIEIVEGKNGQWHWRWVCPGNGQTICHSEQFTRFHGAKRAVLKHLARNFKQWRYVDVRILPRDGTTRARWP